MKHATLFFGIPTLAMIVTHFTLIRQSAETFELSTAFILFLGLILLGIGFFHKGLQKHIILFLGWFVFALYWATQPEYLYYKGDNDIVNGIFCILGVYFLSYISYHEYLSYKRGDMISSLQFLAGATFFAGALYFSFEKIDILAGALIQIVAHQSVALLNIMGYNASVGGISYGVSTSAPIYFNGHESVQVILACTGLQSIAVFVGVLAALKSDVARRVKAAVVIPIIYILNIIRNAGVVYGMEELNLSFYTMHNVVGKAGSLVALVILAFFVFELLPELYDEIMSLVKLPRRMGPIERMFAKGRQ